MKQIDISTPTYPDTFVLVDNEDYVELNKHRWCAERQHKRFYAKRTSCAPDRYSTVRMHRSILNAPTNKEVDHRDGNGLNNQKSNLRLCTRAQNMMNQKIYANNKSGYKGVYWHKTKKKWESNIMANGKLIYLGSFFCLIKAAKAYDAGARKYHGEYANTNF